MKKYKDKIKILFVYSSFLSFVKNDFEILRKHFDVTPYQYNRKRDDLIKIAKAILKNDLVFSWFAVDHAAISVFFSKLFNKKSIVVIGGQDVAFAPEINYGRFMKNWNIRMLTKFAIKYADILLPVSSFTKNEMLKRAKPKRFEILYNCIDTEKFKSTNEKEDIILTIGSVSKLGIKLKGLDTFAKVSSYFPDYKFVIIGRKEDNDVRELKKINPKLIFTGKIEHDEVRKWLQRAKVYCQLSYIESFGMGVAEAMSCGCIPVVTERGGLPEVVGDVGYYVQYGDEKVTAEMIKQALNTPKEFSEKARKIIEEKFSLEKREKELVKIINSLI